jgi:hypothetical protein
MLTERTLRVEITGVFGAGYVPGLIEQVKSALENRYRVRTAAGARMLNVLFSVDNTIAIKANKTYRDELAALTHRAPLTPHEVSRLADGLRWLDGQVKSHADHVRRTVDILLRRGGILQTPALLLDKSWRRVNAERELHPKLPIFLTAPLPQIQRTFGDPMFLAEHAKNAASYCATAERAFELQAWWAKAIKELPGLLFVERSSSDIRETIDGIVARVIWAAAQFGPPLVPKLSVFLSFCERDMAFVQRLKAFLEAQQVDCWFAPERLRTGDELKPTFSDEIASRDAVVLVASRSALDSAWIQYEVMTSLALEQAHRRVIIRPIMIDKDVLTSHEPWAQVVSGRKITDFSGCDSPDQFERRMRDLLVDLLQEPRARMTTGENAH